MTDWKQEAADIAARAAVIKDRAARELVREIPWWKARIAAIKADPAAAGLVAVVTVIMTLLWNHFA